MNHGPEHLQKRALAVAARAAMLHGDRRTRFVLRACRGEASLAEHVWAVLEGADDPASVFRTRGPGVVQEVRVDWRPARVDGCRVIRRIGEGGMGVVFEAEQDVPRRRVAVKALRPGTIGASALRRFAVEQSALALLDHPGIARVHLAGVGREGTLEYPYFVMELIDGRPITEASRERGLSRRQVVELVLQVCEAIQHAHQRGVIHRDLKPSNILVDQSGRARIVDFGVARLVESAQGLGGTGATQCTVTGEFVGTPAYMSPEQAACDAVIDTRSDVYAIGVVLFELLAGEPPHRLAGLPLESALRLIRDAETPRLATRDRSLRGDLDAIAGMAMNKDRERRYGSPAELGGDLARHLRNEPVRARAPGTVYQLGRWCRRHPGRVAAAAGVMVVALAGGWAWQDYSRRAGAEDHSARAVVQIVADLTRPERSTWGKELDEQGLDKYRNMATRVPGVYPQKPDVEAYLFETAALGLVQGGGKADAEAEALFRHALALREQVQGPMEALASRGAVASSALVRILARSHRLEEAEALQLRVIEAVQKSDSTPRRIGVQRGYLADIYRQQGRREACLRTWREAEAEMRALTPTGELAPSWRLKKIFTLRCCGEHEEARRECVSFLSDIDLGLGVPKEIERRAWLLFVQLHVESGDVDGVESALNHISARDADEGMREHVNRLLAGWWWARGDFARAEPSLRAGVSSLRAREIDGDPLFDAVNSLGVCLRDMGRLLEAEPLLRESLANRLRRSCDDCLASVARSRLNLARLLQLDGRFGEARAEASEALRVIEAHGAPMELENIEARALLGLITAEMEGFDGGRPLLEAALDARNQRAQTSWQADFAVDAMACALIAAQRQEDAAALLRGDVARLIALAGEGNLVTIRARARLARLLPRAEVMAGAGSAMEDGRLRTMGPAPDEASGRSDASRETGPGGI